MTGDKANIVIGDKANIVIGDSAYIQRAPRAKDRSPRREPWVNDVKLSRARFSGRQNWVAQSLP